MNQSPVKTWSTPVREEGKACIPCALCAGGHFKPYLACNGFAYVKCAACGLVQINPQPLAEQVRRRYRELSGSEYLSYELRNEAAFLELQLRALADAGFYQLEQELMAKGGAPGVLDLGCATGAMLAFLRGRGWQVTGVEISPSAEYGRTVRALNVYTAAIEDCRLPETSFDLALASHLLEHLNSPAVFLREVWRVLKPGARLLLTTPNIDGFQARLFSASWRSAIFDHLYLFSKRTIKRMLGDAGFITERMYTWGGLAAGTAPLPVKRLADRAVKALGLGDVMLVKARKAPG